MLKKRSKKGLSHVDWAISLSIFLLYLAWFFVFVKPQLMPPENVDVLLDILDEGVKDQVFEDLNRVQILLEGDGEDQVVIVPFTRDWAEDDIRISEDHFVLDRGKMFFLANLSDTNTVDVYYPHDAMALTTKPGVVATEDHVQYQSFRAEFEDYLVDQAYFRGAKRLHDMYIDVEEVEIDDDGSYENMELMARYERSDIINHTTYVMAKNSGLYNYVSSADLQNHSVRIRMTLDNYTNYYFDDSRKGELTYYERVQCKYYESDYIDLYANTGISIRTDREITFILCTNRTKVLIGMEFDLGSTLRYDVVFHDGTYLEVESVEPKMGTVETLNTISREKVLGLNNKDYDYLKTLFRYPDDRDFNVTVDGIDASYGIAQTGVKNIYARKIRGYQIGKNFEEEKVDIQLTVW
ncbi:hypothetical protein ACFL0V_06405 [Nanoarchaeota archaeon]